LPNSPSSDRSPHIKKTRDDIFITTDAQGRIVNRCESIASAFIIRVYMSVFMVPGSVTAMVTGFVSRDWAWSHHRLCYQQVIGKRGSTK
jgi:hypothetical protein